MDPDLPVQIMQAPSPKKYPGKTPLIILAAIILLILIGASYYFLIFQKKPTPSPAAEQTDSIPKLAERSISCPLSADLCKAQDSVKESSFSAELKTDTPLLAAFDGTIDAIELEDYTLLTLTNRKNHLAAQYYFKGSAPASKQVKEGDVIGTASGAPLNTLDNKSFVFVVLGINRKGNSGLEPLSAENFK